MAHDITHAEIRNVCADYPYDYPSQLVQNSEPVNNSTDRPIEDKPKNSSPADAPAPQAPASGPARITRGVKYTQLRRELHQALLKRLLDV